MRNATKQSKAEAVKLAVRGAMSNTFEQVFHKASMALLPPSTGISLVVSEISQCRSGRSAAKYRTLVSNRITFREATWLNRNLTLSVYSSQRPAVSFPPLQKTERLTERGLEAFLLCHFCLTGERFPAFEIHRSCCHVHNACIFSYFSGLASMGFQSHQNAEREEVTCCCRESDTVLPPSKMWFQEDQTLL